MSEQKAELYEHDLSVARWRKAKESGPEHNRVEINDLPGGGIAVRDSKNPHLQPLGYTATEWSMFRRAMMSGEL
ncbi:hypothetical protein GCM10027160_17360 [Streptomyces calidiresistens]|uniref:DUF397 domain-containing protein n=1 Tax=Streptomyces calidiresistens TaxID=1485586 RepID=A0A7W3SZL5_9ACTN|nr:DUF397 domain-containing protein [Streptomyces calidiresistens]MBB0228198.1 DUF397 domain-containing protein [Streptomyces calidiresistens]